MPPWVTSLNIKKGRRKIKACFSLLKIPYMYTAGSGTGGPLARGDPGEDGNGLSSPAQLTEKPWRGAESRKEPRGWPRPLGEWGGF